MKRKTRTQPQGEPIPSLEDLNAQFSATMAEIKAHLDLNVKPLPKPVKTLLRKLASIMFLTGVCQKASKTSAPGSPAYKEEMRRAMEASRQAIAAEEAKDDA